MSPDSGTAGEGVEEIKLLSPNSVRKASRGTKTWEPTSVFSFSSHFSKLQLNPILTSFTLTNQFQLLLWSLLSNRKQDNGATQGINRVVSFHPILSIEKADSSRSCQGSQEVKVLL